MWSIALLWTGCEVFVASEEARQDALGLVTDSGTSVRDSGTTELGFYASVGPIRDLTNRGEDCVILDDGSVRCWYGSFIRADAQASEPSRNDFVRIESGRSHLCAIRESGAADCWGGDFEFDPYVDGKPEQEFYPGPIDDLRAGDGFTCVESGGVWSCSGFDRPLEDLNGKPIDLNGLSITDLDGYDLVCAIVDNEVRCWGDSGNDFADANTFAAVAKPRKIRVGMSRDVCVIDEDKALWCSWNLIKGPDVNDAELIAQAVDDVDLPRSTLSPRDKQVCWLSGGAIDCIGDGIDDLIAAQLPIPGPFTKIAGRGERYLCGILAETRAYRCFGEPPYEDPDSYPFY